MHTSSRFGFAVRVGLGFNQGVRRIARPPPSAARAVICVPSALLSAKEQDIKNAVAKEMGPDLFSEKHRGSAPFASMGSRPESRNGGLTVPGAETALPSIVGHPGLEDRLHAMMFSLRSLQAKIRVCAEEISVSTPPALHGISDGTSRSPEPTVASSSPAQIDDRTRIVQLERTMESMRDDLLGLSAEWEASIKLLHKEKRRSPSPNLGSEVESELASFRGARDLQSPLEADEDAATTPGQAQTSKQDEAESPLLHQQDGSDDDEDDGDLAQLLLRSTSPNSLPPPGLEQVFESIAGMAGLSGLGVPGGKASRAERIELARRQREEKQPSRRRDSKGRRPDFIWSQSPHRVAGTALRLILPRRRPRMIPWALLRSSTCIGMTTDPLRK